MSAAGALSLSTTIKKAKMISGSVFRSVEKVAGGLRRTRVGSNEPARPSQQGCVIGSVFSCRVALCSFFATPATVQADKVDDVVAA